MYTWYGIQYYCTVCNSPWGSIISMYVCLHDSKTPFMINCLILLLINFHRIVILSQCLYYPHVYITNTLITMKLLLVNIFWEKLQINLPWIHNYIALQLKVSTTKRMYILHHIKRVTWSKTAVEIAIMNDNLSHLRIVAF